MYPRDWICQTQTVGFFQLRSLQQHFSKVLVRILRYMVSGLGISAGYKVSGLGINAGYKVSLWLHGELEK